MKFVLILAFTVLAVSANMSSLAGSLDLSKPHLVNNSEGRDTLIDGLSKIIRDIIKETQQTLDDIVAKLEELLQNFADTIQKAVDEAKDLINKTANKALKILDQIAKQDEISRECVEKSLPDIDEAISKHNLEIQACQDKAIEDVQNIKNDVEPQIEAIRDNIGSLEGIVSECIESNGNILGVVQCIFIKTDEIKTELARLINNAKNALVTGQIRANEIVRNARVCIENSNDKFEKRISEIIKNVNQCIKDNQSALY